MLVLFPILILVMNSVFQASSSDKYVYFVVGKPTHVLLQMIDSCTFLSVFW